MPSELRSEDRVWKLDDSGFLAAPEQWSESFATEMACHLGMHGGLDERHFRVIHYLRREHADGRVPYFVIACMQNGLKLSEFRALFPTGYCRGACRLAGLSYEAIYASDPAHLDEIVPRASSRYPLSATGFLTRFEAWDESFATALAASWKMPPLTPRHWQVIGYLRDFFLAHRVVPVVYETCRACGLSLEELETLFPAGYRRGACRIAGLPYGP